MAARDYVSSVRDARATVLMHSPERVRQTQVSTTFVSCPADANKSLGIKMPHLVMIIKNMRKYFSFEVTVRGVQASRSTLPKLCPDYVAVHSPARPGSTGLR